MSIPIIVVMAAYFLLFLVWVIMTIANVYHVLRYAYWTRLPLALVFVYFFFAVCIVVGTGWFLRDVDWTATESFTTPDITMPDVTNPFANE